MLLESPFQFGRLRGSHWGIVTFVGNAVPKSFHQFDTLGQWQRFGGFQQVSVHMVIVAATDTNGKFGSSQKQRDVRQRDSRIEGQIKMGLGPFGSGQNLFKVLQVVGDTGRQLLRVSFEKLEIGGQ
jgi:hypothetical protein